MKKGSVISDWIFHLSNPPRPATITLFASDTPFASVNAVEDICRNCDSDAVTLLRTYWLKVSHRNIFKTLWIFIWKYWELNGALILSVSNAMRLLTRRWRASFSMRCKVIARDIIKQIDVDGGMANDEVLCLGRGYESNSAFNLIKNKANMRCSYDANPWWTREARSGNPFLREQTMMHMRLSWENVGNSIFIFFSGY